MMQMIDGPVTISRSRTEDRVILDLRVVSSFALVETDNQAMMEAFEP
jgi:hypothetical protein